MKFGPVSIDEAEGAVLAHSVRLDSGDLKKGRTLDGDDIEALRQAGIAQVLVARFDAGDVPEDAAATRLARALPGTADPDRRRVHRPRQSLRRGGRRLDHRHRRHRRREHDRRGDHGGDAGQPCGRRAGPDAGDREDHSLRRTRAGAGPGRGPAAASGARAAPASLRRLERTAHPDGLAGHVIEDAGQDHADYRGADGRGRRRTCWPRPAARTRQSRSPPRSAGRWTRGATCC